MEFKDVVARRKSIRDYRPDKRVEMEKIKVILEAARLAPCASNLNVLRAVVLERDKVPKRLRDSIPDFNNVHISQAPILICWYVDMQAWKDRPEKMKELIDAGALKPAHGWSHDYIDNVYMKAGLRKPPEVINYIEGGMGIAFAMLAAVNEGLGTCLNTCNVEEATTALGLPETATLLWIMSIGYTALPSEAESQRPRRPFEELFSLNDYGTPFTGNE